MRLQAYHDIDTLHNDDRHLRWYEKDRRGYNTAKMTAK